MNLLMHQAVLAELWAYWNEKRRGVLLPSRDDIDPVQIPTLLPHLQIMDRTAEGEFCYRLAGTAVASGYGRDPTGKLVREVLSPERLVIALARYGKAWSSGRPLWSRNRYAAPGGAEQIVTRIILPLAEDGRAVNMLLLGQTFEGIWTSFGRTGVDWTLRGAEEWGFLTGDTFRAAPIAAAA
jgi:hypothetical protein